ncbi:MAG: hypothetical protein H7Z43_15890 [Clostridia bacterium]|nr:hypothetical protein [Deltaproteobacteria bacterium]
MNVSPQAARALRLTVFALLLVSAAASFLLADKLWTAVRSGTLPIWAALIAPAAFTVFVLVYAVDRYIQVVRHGYPFVRAVFQIGLATIFLVLLWPQTAYELRETRDARRGVDPIFRLLNDRDDDVRAAACELAGLRHQFDAFDAATKLAEHDRSPDVREACETAASAIASARPVQHD